MRYYKYSHLENGEEIDYDTMRKKCKEISNNTCHYMPRNIRVLKLFFSELLFLSNNARDGDTILYIGAAPGIHLLKLTDMFPKCKFDLWDPLQIDDGLKQKKNVVFHNAKFTEEDAKNYIEIANECLLITDIRDISIYATYVKTLESIPVVDSILTNDMQTQLRWCKIIRPRKAFLEFTLPYTDKTVPYLSGNIYLQPFGALGTETKLSTSNYHAMVIYDSKTYNHRMHFHNLDIRCRPYISPAWYQITEKYGLCDIWDVVYSLYICELYIRNILEIQDNTQERAAKMFVRMITFFAKTVDDYRFSLITMKNTDKDEWADSLKKKAEHAYEEIMKNQNKHTENKSNTDGADSILDTL